MGTNYYAKIDTCEDLECPQHGEMGSADAEIVVHQASRILELELETKQLQNKLNAVIRTLGYRRADGAYVLNVGVQDVRYLLISTR